MDNANLFCGEGDGKEKVVGRLSVYRGGGRFLATHAVSGKVGGLAFSSSSDIRTGATIVQVQTAEGGTEVYYIKLADLLKIVAAEVSERWNEKEFVVCTGQRTFHNANLVDAALSTLPKTTFVVHGECDDGADVLVDGWCRRKGQPMIRVPAPWKGFGRASGPVRNGWMLDIFKPRFVIAFYNDLQNSKGTKNTISQARQRGITVIMVKDTDVEAEVVKTMHTYLED